MAHGFVGRYVPEAPFSGLFKLDATAAYASTVYLYGRVGGVEGPRTDNPTNKRGGVGYKAGLRRVIEIKCYKFHRSTHLIADTKENLK